MVKVVISGAGGRMGMLLAKAVIEGEETLLSGAVERGDHPLIGKDIGEVAGQGKSGVTVCDNLEDIKDEWDLLVEFSTARATLSHLPIAERKGKAVVIGTTGFSEEEKKEIAEYTSKIPVLISPNMSIGVNLLFRVAGEVAKVLGPEYDVEIVETHHRMKKDAPSGTALKLGEIIASARGENFKEVTIFGRNGATGKRADGQICIHAVRGGTVTGEHTVIFAGNNERIELSHRAESREVFVQGVIRAIGFLAKASPGLYGMQDLIS